MMFSAPFAMPESTCVIPTGTWILGMGSPTARQSSISDIGQLSYDDLIDKARQRAERRHQRKLKRWNYLVELVLRVLTDHNKAVEIRNRTWHFRTYKKCFIGAELVASLCEQLTISRENATLLGEEMHQLGIISHVTKGHCFEDAYLFYRFSPDGIESHNVMKTGELAIDVKPDMNRFKLLVGIATLMISSAHPLNITNKLWQNRTWIDCFTSTEFLDWLMAYHNMSREEAHSIGSEMFSTGIIENANHDHSFTDGFFFYRFVIIDGNFLAPQNGNLPAILKREVENRVSHMLRRIGVKPALVTMIRAAGILTLSQLANLSVVELTEITRNNFVANVIYDHLHEVFPSKLPAQRKRWPSIKNILRSKVTSKRSQQKSPENATNVPSFEKSKSFPTQSNSPPKRLSTIRSVSHASSNSTPVSVTIVNPRISERISLTSPKRPRVSKSICLSPKIQLTSFRPISECNSLSSSQHSPSALISQPTSPEGTLVSQATAPQGTLISQPTSPQGTFISQPTSPQGTLISQHTSPQCTLISQPDTITKSVTSHPAGGNNTDKSTSKQNATAQITNTLPPQRTARITCSRSQSNLSVVNPFLQLKRGATSPALLQKVSWKRWIDDDSESVDINIKEEEAKLVNSKRKLTSTLRNLVSREKSRSPNREKSRSPNREKSRSPSREKSRSPSREKSRSPNRVRSRSPNREKSRSPNRDDREARLF
eukprot:800410_1